MKYYELTHFYGRKNIEYNWLETTVNKDNCQSDDDFLDKVVVEGKMTYAETQQVTEIVEITKSDYEVYSDQVVM